MRTFDVRTLKYTHTHTSQCNAKAIERPDRSILEEEE